MVEYILILIVGIIISRICLGISVKILEYFKLKTGDYNIKDLISFNGKYNKVKKIITDVFSVLSVYYIFSVYDELSNLSLVMLIILLLILLLTMITDLLEGYILNIYTYSGIVLIGILNFIEPERLSLIWNYLGGFLAVIIIFGIVLLIMPGKMGLGDVKLFLLLGIYFGFLDLIVLMFISTFIGLIYGVYKLLIKKESDSFVFGPFISYGSLLVLLFDISLPML